PPALHDHPHHGALPSFPTRRSSDLNEQQGSSHHDPGQGGAVLHASRERGDRYVPKSPGTVDKLNLYYGPYTIPPGWDANRVDLRSEEHTSELQSRENLVCRLLLEKK